MSEPSERMRGELAPASRTAMGIGGAAPAEALSDTSDVVYPHEAGLAGQADQAEARRERFRSEIARLAGKARTADPVRALLLPAAISLVLGFAVIFLGWYGAAHSFRVVEQLPYMISGGFFGLALVILGGLLLAAALWTSQLRSAQQQAEERARQQLEAVEARFAEELRLIREDLTR